MLVLQRFSMFACHNLKIFILLVSLSSKYFKASGFGRFSFSTMPLDNFENEDVEQMLRERRPTFENTDELLEMMARTRDERR